MKPPKDTKVYKVAMAYIALKAQGLKLQEISDRLVIPKDTINTYVKRAHKNGWITRSSFGDIQDKLEISLPEQIVENVATVLTERNTSGDLTAGAREMTLEAAKGLGIFKNHQAVKVDGQVGVGFALKVQVELPPGIAQSSPIQIRPGSIGGQPAMDADVIDAEEA